MDDPKLKVEISMLGVVPDLWPEDWQERLKLKIYDELRKTVKELDEEPPKRKPS